MEWCKQRKQFLSGLREYLEIKRCYCEECNPRPKEEKKLLEILIDAYNRAYEKGDNEECYKAVAQAAIEAVIKVYEEWDTHPVDQSFFKDYLKEKLL